jgi:HD superfamily phosphohydrolase
MKYFFPKDNFWLRDNLNVSINRQALNSIPGTQIKDDKIEIECKQNSEEDTFNGAQSLKKYKNKISSYDNIGSFNQLGIKDYLLQRVDKELHNRKSHSYGTAIIGICYFSAIKPFIEYTIFKKIDVEKCERLLNLALLLHDIGHLPFSHLMEEIFNDVNWTRGRGKYHHDEGLPEEDRKGIKEALRDALDIQNNNDIEEYFELLQDLIAGISGVPFLDAIVNSPIDADKIDYIFRDMKYTGTMARLEEPQQWLMDFFSNISLSPEGLVRLNGHSSLCALQLLKERQFLYQTLYLRPDIRAFEKIAATVIISWLTQMVSENIIIPQNLKPDLRKAKGDKAYELLINKFYMIKDEFELLINICEELGSDNNPHQDKEAKGWFNHIKSIFEKFKGNSSTRLLKELSDEMIVEEPLYFGREKAEEIKKIARDLYIDYPCWVLIDVVESPKFLSYPRSRRIKIQNKEFVGEQFLVPDYDINKWNRKKIAHVPLHMCNFHSLEKKYTQVVVVNTLSGKKRGEYIYDLFIKRCRTHGIEPIPFQGGE